MKLVTVEVSRVVTETHRVTVEVPDHDKWTPFWEELRDELSSSILEWEREEPSARDWRFHPVPEDEVVGSQTPDFRLEHNSLRRMP